MDSIKNKSDNQINCFKEKELIIQFQRDSYFNFNIFGEFKKCAEYAELYYINKITENFNSYQSSLKTLEVKNTGLGHT